MLSEPVAVSPVPAVSVVLSEGCWDADSVPDGSVLSEGVCSVEDSDSLSEEVSSVEDSDPLSEGVSSVEDSASLS